MTELPADGPAGFPRWAWITLATAWEIVLAAGEGGYVMAGLFLWLAFLGVTMLRDLWQCLKNTLLLGRWTRCTHRWDPVGFADMRCRDCGAWRY